MDNYFDVDQVEGASIDSNYSPDKSSKLLDNRCLSLRGECDEPLQSLIEVSVAYGILKMTMHLLKFYWLICYQLRKYIF